MKQTKRILSLACTAILILSLAACGNKNTTDYSGQTLYGQVTKINDNTITVQLGEWTESQTQEQGQPPEMPTENGDGSETPPAMPEGDNDGSQTPPEKPEGDSGDSQTPPAMPEENIDNSQTPPDMPEGDGDNSQTPPEMPDMSGNFTAGEDTASFDLSKATITIENGQENAEGNVSDIQVDDILEITVDDNNTVSAVTVKSLNQLPGGGGFGGSGEVVQGAAANTIDADGTYSDTTYSSTGDDENALLIDGATATLDNVKVEKTAGATSNTENGDFYGVNAALLATNGAQVTIAEATVTSSAQNGNGIFSYGEGTVVDISDSTITTTADNSGGIQTTGGGTTNADHLTVETSGNSSAAIRSDRGGGTVNVDDGTYTSNGYNSPAVYSTADITVKNAELTANNSEALVIEGKNSITLENCDVTGNMSDTKGASSDTNVHNVMIYQSMSGDADVGTSTFSMTGGTLSSQNGDMFYITNTHAAISLSGVTINNQETDGYLMKVSGNDASHGWGTAGSNGAQVNLTAQNQDLSGDIVVDTISTLQFTLSEGSALEGTINIIDNEEGGTAVNDNAVVTVDSGCTWTLTGNCTVTSLTNNGTIHFNGYTITLADGTVLS